MHIVHSLCLSFSIVLCYLVRWKVKTNILNYQYGGLVRVHKVVRGELICGDEMKLVRTEDDIRLMKGEIKLVRPVRLAGACRIDL